MGKLPLSVTVSAALHGAAVAWIASQDVARPRQAVREVSTVPIELVEPARPPTEVTLFDEPGATSQPTLPGATDVRASAAGDRASRGVASPGRGDQQSRGVDGRPTRGVDAPGGGEPSPPGERSPYFDMRRTSRADLGLPASRDDLEHVPAGTAPSAGVPASGQLAPDGTGTKSDQGPFVAKVDRDGRVTIKDRPDVSIRWAVPTPKMVGKAFAEWYESDKGPDGQRGKRTLESEVSGSIDAEDRSKAVIIPVFRGGLNPTDWLMRRTVGDPYASKKRAFLDATREERAQIRANHRAEQLSQTQVIVRANLERAWASTTDMTLRKQLVFELWDEIVEPRDDDSTLAEASRAARAQVIGFIRARLPQRDRDAYSPSEIAACNARRQSKETFSPYD